MTNVAVQLLCGGAAGDTVTQRERERPDEPALRLLDRNGRELVAFPLAGLRRTIDTQDARIKLDLFTRFQVRLERGCNAQTGLREAAAAFFAHVLADIDPFAYLAFEPSDSPPDWEVLLRVWKLVWPDLRFALRPADEHRVPRAIRVYADSVSIKLGV